ncbi:hypothetical protein [Limibacillus halophilus]|jgi:hypothetical protein
MPKLPNPFRLLFSSALTLLVSFLLVKAQVVLGLALLAGGAAGLIGLPLFDLMVRNRADWH